MPTRLNLLAGRMAATISSAVYGQCGAIILMHNHPSNQTTPSETDIKVTRNQIQGGQILKIEILNHIVIGNVNQTSLRESGYFYQQSNSFAIKLRRWQSFFRST